jgi:hypothetical protein
MYKIPKPDVIGRLRGSGTGTAGWSWLVLDALGLLETMPMLAGDCVGCGFDTETLFWFAEVLSRQLPPVSAIRFLGGTVFMMHILEVGPEQGELVLKSAQLYESSQLDVALALLDATPELSTVVCDLDVVHIVPKKHDQAGRHGVLLTIERAPSAPRALAVKVSDPTQTGTEHEQMAVAVAKYINESVAHPGWTATGGADKCPVITATAAVEDKKKQKGADDAEVLDPSKLDNQEPYGYCSVWTAVSHVVTAALGTPVTPEQIWRDLLQWHASPISQAAPRALLHRLIHTISLSLSEYYLRSNPGQVGVARCCKKK